MKFPEWTEHSWITEWVEHALMFLKGNTGKIEELQDFLSSRCVFLIKVMIQRSSMITCTLRYMSPIVFPLKSTWYTHYNLIYHFKSILYWIRFLSSYLFSFGLFWKCWELVKSFDSLVYDRTKWWIFRIVYAALKLQ